VTEPRRPSGKRSRRKREVVRPSATLFDLAVEPL
jgi:hypothetical protein